MTPNAKRSLNIIDVKSPCDEPWREMEVAGPGKRNCALCMQDVYDLSEMTKDEAETLVFESTGRVCVRFFRRIDGTIVTSDCSPVRFRQLREAGRGSLRIAAKVIGAVVAVLTLLGFARFAGLNPFGWLGGSVQGEMAVQGGMVHEPLPVDTHGQFGAQ
ncbi:MAG: hypothetical protein ACI9KE_001132 [Polyangiales bacterium]|jgi:hypothetical protein